MAADETTDINYTREAFMHPVNLVSLLAGTVASFLLMGTELFSGVMFTFLIGAELTYLGVMPQLESFRRSVEMKKRREQNGEPNNKAVFHRLDARSQKRYLVLRHIASEIKKNFEQLAYTSQGMLDSIRKKVDGLLSTYLKLLDMYNKYKLYVQSEVEDELRVEIAAQRKKLEEIDSDKLRETRMRRILILEKRMAKFEAAREKYLICETHLETLEDAVRFIYEQSITLPGDDDVGSRLDHLLEEMEETSQLIDELEGSVLPGFDHLDQELELAELRKEADQPDGTQSKSINQRA
ncbi:MAG: hypothetical protein ACNA78_05995 [Balneolaceae bacterium]